LGLGPDGATAEDDEEGADAAETTDRRGEPVGDGTGLESPESESTDDEEGLTAETAAVFHRGHPIDGGVAATMLMLSAAPADEEEGERRARSIGRGRSRWWRSRRWDARGGTNGAFQRRHGERGRTEGPMGMAARGGRALGADVEDVLGVDGSRATAREEDGEDVQGEHAMMVRWRRRT